MVKRKDAKRRRPEEGEFWSSTTALRPILLTRQGATPSITISSANQMNLSWRYASVADLGLLADWNHQLIRDEGARNPMTVEQLAERMKSWLAGEYKAVVFSDVAPVAYALFRREETLIYLRQLFVRRDRRRSGVGRAAMDILKGEIWPPDLRLTVEVLTDNRGAVAFWRSVGYRDYCLTLEIMPAAKGNQ